MRTRGTEVLRFAPRALLALGLSCALALACKGSERRETGSRPGAEQLDASQNVAALYQNDSGARAVAAERLVARGQAAVPLLDPFESGCIRSDSFPVRCQNFDRALDQTITILSRIAGNSRDSANLAKDLLWRLLHAHTGDAFEDLSQRAEWQRTNADALRKHAADILDSLMALPAHLSEAEVRARGAAQVQNSQVHWYLVSNCAGEAMNLGCNYGSYLFAADGRPVSFRMIRWDQLENPGGGTRLALILPAGPATIGVVHAVGGFGGDVERLVFYRLDSQQAPLCLVETARTTGHLLQRYSRYVSVDQRGCRVIRRNQQLRVQFLS
jgi:hypothetical protein